MRVSLKVGCLYGDGADLRYGWSIPTYRSFQSHTNEEESSLKLEVESASRDSHTKHFALCA